MFEAGVHLATIDKVSLGWTTQGSLLRLQGLPRLGVL